MAPKQLRRLNTVGVAEEFELRETSYGIGASWDLIPGKPKIDIDMQCVVVDTQGVIIDCAYYNKLKVLGAITHSGDEQTGATRGIDELVWIDFEKLPDKVAILIFVIAAHSGGFLKDVANGKLHVLANSKTNEIASFAMEQTSTGVDVVATVFRNSSGWTLRIIDEAGQDGQHFMDILPLLANVIRDVIPSAPKKQKIAFAIEKEGAMDFPKDQDSITIGVGWGDKSGEVDLDVTAVLLDSYTRVEEAVSVDNLESTKHGVRHSGDYRAGQGDGDDKQIVVKLGSVGADVQDIVFVINIFTRGVTFQQLRNPYCQVTDDASQVELCRYHLQDAGDQQGLIVARIARDPVDRWCFHAVGKPCRGKTLPLEDIKLICQRAHPPTETASTERGAGRGEYGASSFSTASPRSAEYAGYPKYATSQAASGAISADVAFAIVDRLEQQKSWAVANEEYELAAHLKKKIPEAQALADSIAEMQVQKQTAAAAEDFEAAAAAKRSIQDASLELSTFDIPYSLLATKRKEDVEVGDAKRLVVDNYKSDEKLSRSPINPGIASIISDTSVDVEQGATVKAEEAPVSKSVEGVSDDKPSLWSASTTCSSFTGSQRGSHRGRDSVADSRGPDFDHKPNCDSVHEGRRENELEEAAVHAESALAPASSSSASQASQLIGTWEYYSEHQCRTRKYTITSALVFEEQEVQGVLVQGQEWLEGDVGVGGVKTGCIRIKITPANPNRAESQIKRKGSTTWNDSMFATRVQSEDARSHEALKTAVSDDKYKQWRPAVRAESVPSTAPSSSANQASQLIATWEYYSKHQGRTRRYTITSALAFEEQEVHGVLVQGQEWLEGDVGVGGVTTGRIRIKIAAERPDQAESQVKMKGSTTWSDSMFATRLQSEAAQSHESMKSAFGGDKYQRWRPFLKISADDGTSAWIKLLTHDAMLQERWQRSISIRRSRIRAEIERSADFEPFSDEFEIRPHRTEFPFDVEVFLPFPRASSKGLGTVLLRRNKYLVDTKLLDSIADDDFGRDDLWSSVNGASWLDDGVKFTSKRLCYYVVGNRSRATATFRATPDLGTKEIKLSCAIKSLSVYASPPAGAWTIVLNPEKRYRISARKADLAASPSYHMEFTWQPDVFGFAEVSQELVIPDASPSNTKLEIFFNLPGHDPKTHDQADDHVSVPWRQDGWTAFFSNIRDLNLNAARWLGFLHCAQVTEDGSISAVAGVDTLLATDLSSLIVSAVEYREKWLGIYQPDWCITHHGFAILSLDSGVRLCTEKYNHQVELIRCPAKCGLEQMIQRRGTDELRRGKVVEYKRFDIRSGVRVDRLKPWLNQKTNESYDLIRRNCQVFVSDLFDFLAGDAS